VTVLSKSHKTKIGKSVRPLHQTDVSWFDVSMENAAPCIVNGPGQLGDQFRCATVIVHALRDSIKLVALYHPMLK
jgi:hypothetical protein